MTDTRNSIRWGHIFVALMLVAALDIYELLVSIPSLAATAGQPIFDMRVNGYGTGEAVALLSALGSDGRWYYLSRHTTADTALALVEAGAIALIILRATRPGARFAVHAPRRWRLAMMAAPVLTLALDLAENALVAHMLITPPPGALQVAIASTITQAKWGGYALSIALAVVLPLAALRNGRRSRPDQSQQPAPS